MVATPIVVGGAAGVGMYESLGGRHVARGTNGVTWIVVAEISGINHYLVAYFLGIGSSQATREVIAGPGVSLYTAIAVCVDTTNQPVVAFTTAAITGVSFYRREAGTWTAKTGFTAADSTGDEGVAVSCRESGTFDVIFTNHRSSTTTASIQHRVNTVDLGGAWAAATTVDSVVTSNTEQKSGRRVAMVADHSGNLHAVWVLRGTSSWPIKYATYNGTSWSALQTIVTPPTNSTSYAAKHLSIAVDGSGVPHVAYSIQTRDTFVGITGIYFAHRTGGAWSTPEQIHDTVNSNQTMPSITVDQVGDVDIVWRGGLLVSNLGYDSIYRAHGTVSSLAVERIADLGAASIQPEVPFAWEPFGHGFFDAGYFVVSAVAGSPPSIIADSALSWVHEPVAMNTMGAVQTAFKGSSQYAFANALDLAQTALGTRDRLVFAENRIDFTQLIALPRGANLLLFTQLASTAGSVWTRHAGNVLDFSQIAIRESPVSCETTYVPSPVISTNEDDILSTALQGPWPSISRKVKLPRPTYGDSRAPDLRVLTLRTMHGEVHQSAQSGTLREFTVMFPQLSRKKAIELQDFLDAMTGQEIVWSDVNGHRWQVLAMDTAASVRRAGIEYGGQITLTLSGTMLP